MTLDIGCYATTMARYNRWMNERLYSVAGTLTEQQLREERGLFFGSIYGTLNHLLVCDRMCLARFAGQPSPVTSLTEELCRDFTRMTRAREQTDQDISAWARTLVLSPPPEWLHYVSLADRADRRVNFSRAIVHFFNHQTHHRGQVTAALSQQGLDFGVTDLIFMPENE